MRTDYILGRCPVCRSECLIRMFVDKDLIFAECTCCRTVIALLPLGGGARG